MAQELEVAQFLNEDCVAYVEIGRCGIEAGLDPKRPAALDGLLEAIGQFHLGKNLHYPLAD